MVTSSIAYSRRLAFWMLGAWLCCLVQNGLAQELGAPWRIYNSSSLEEVSLQALAETLAPADVVFFGEVHTDSVAHVLEDSLYALLLRQYGEVTLSLEMFETDVQPVVDEFLAELISRDRLKTDARAWSNYDVAYHSLVLRARGQGQAVVAANAPRRYVSLVGQQGTAVLDRLPQRSRRFLPKRPWRYIDTAYQRRFATLMASITGQEREVPVIKTRVEDISPMFAAQVVWDATMARSIHQALRTGRKRNAKVYHLNGSFHSDYHQGAVAQLHRLNRRAVIQTISVVQVEELASVDWVDYQGLADFVILH